MVRIKGILFDLWGTLFYTDLNPHPFEEIATLVGHKLSYKEDYAFVKLFEECFLLGKYDYLEGSVYALLEHLDLPKEKTPEIAALFRKTIRPNIIKPYAETICTLNQLKGKYKLGLLTNCSRLQFDIVNKEYRLDEYFANATLSCDVGILKPDARIYDNALSNLALHKKECIMVGDSLQDDVDGAITCGLHSAYLIDRNEKFPNHPRRISSLTEIITKLE